jgi:Tol biopolymer transport system component
MNTRATGLLGILFTALLFGGCDSLHGLDIGKGSGNRDGQTSGTGDTGDTGDTGGTGDGSASGGATSVNGVALLYQLASTGILYESAVAGDASRVVFALGDNPLGTNPQRAAQLFGLNLATGVLSQITNEPSGGIRENFDIDENATKVVFSSREDYTGDNAGNRNQIFVANTDGSVIVQVTRITKDADILRFVQLSGDGSVIVFSSNSDLTGDNPAEFRRLFSINSDGTGVAQIGQFFTGSELSLSDDGSKVAFQSSHDPLGNNGDINQEIFVVDTDGSNLTQISMTDSGRSWQPQLSDDGSRVVFVTDGDPLPGGNDDENHEVFVSNTDGTGLIQITSSTEGGSGIDSESSFLNRLPGAVDISGDGNYILFGSDADLTGDNLLADHTLFWATADGTVIEQQLRSDTIPGGTTGITDRSYLNFDGSKMLIDTWQNYSPDATSNTKKLYLMTRQ